LLPTLLTMARRLCAPLAFLHGEGILHRDLKPENILLVERQGISPVLVDFGIASQYGGESSRETLELDSGITRTAHSMSPEQIQGEPLDARADLYAFGVILYELVTGRKPFRGETPAAVLRAHLTEPPQPPSALSPGLPPALDALCLRL